MYTPVYKSLNVHICVCMYTCKNALCLYAQVWVCMRYLHACMCKCIWVCVHVHECDNSHVYVDEYVHILFTGVDILVYYACECAYVWVCICVHVCIHVCLV